jgi:hypothetical protein
MPVALLKEHAPSQKGRANQDIHFLLPKERTERYLTPFGYANGDAVLDLPKIR